MSRSRVLFPHREPYAYGVTQFPGGSSDHSRPERPGLGRPLAPGAHGQARTPRLRGKAWLLLAVPLGFTTWAAFLYIGIRARRAQWLAGGGGSPATPALYGALGP